MHETSGTAKVLTSDTPLRLRRAAVFARAAELGAQTGRERWELMGLSRPTYYRLLSDEGVLNMQRRTIQNVLAGLQWTAMDQAFEAAIARRAAA